MALSNRIVIRFAIPAFSRVKFEILCISRKVSEHRGVSLLALLMLLVAGAIAPLVGQQKARRGGRENERDSAALIRKRADWFLKQRAYPLGFIPAGARMKAIQQMEEMRRAQGTLMDRFAAREQTTAQSFGTIPALSMSNWTSIGPQPTSDPNFNLTSGRVNAIAVDPCDTTGNTVYIAGAQGGVWKTTNGGTNWTPLTDSQPSLAGGSLAVDPVVSDCASGHTGAIYFGTGEENFSFDSFYGSGVLTSRDGGTTWTQDKTFMPSTTPQSADSAGPFIGSLDVSHAPGSSGLNQILLAGIQGVSNSIHSGVYRSTDGGSNWMKVLPASSSTFDFGTGVAFDPGDSTGQTAYAALGIPFPSGSNPPLEANNGLWKSIDGGNTWSRVMSLDNAVTGAGLNTANYGRMTIALAPATSAPNPANTTIVVAVADITSSSDVLLGTFISTNGGTSFAPLTAGNSNAFCNSQCFYDIAVGIDPANPLDIFLGGGPNADGSGSGLSSVIFSNNAGATFGDVSSAGSGFAVHVDTHAFAFAHPSGGGTIVYVGDDGGVWSSLNVETSPGSQTWSDLNTNLSLTQFYPGNSIHPSNPQVGFAGAQDNGTQKFDPTFNASNPQETQNVAACGDGGWTAIDPSTPSTVYAACEDINQLGTINKNQLDGEPGGSGNTFGQNWISIDTPAIDADNANFVPPLVLDSANPPNIYFGTCRVWQSINGGLFWTDISGGLDGSVAKGALPPAGCPSGSLVITTMAVAPSDSNTLYVGAESPQPAGGIISSLFVSATAGMGASASFGPLPTSSVIPNGRVVTQIAVSPTTKTTAYITYSGFSSCVGATPPCDSLGHVFKFDAAGAGGSGMFTDITGTGPGKLPDVPVNDIVIDPNDATENTIYIATDVGVFGTTNAQASPSSNVTWSVLQSGLPHVECTSLKLNNTARVLLVGTHGRGDWELQLGGLAASALTGMSPTSATAGGSAFTLTLNGQGFGVNPNVNFGATSLPSVGSGTQLTVAVPVGAIASSGVDAVTVAGASGSLNFSIEGPLPILSVPVSPSSVTGTSSPVTVTVNGSNFAANTDLAWTPTSGSQTGNTTLVAQNPGGTSTSFTVTVPATLLQSTLAHMVPVTPSRRPWPGPKYWLFVALFAAVAGLLLFTFVPRRRRLIFGTAAATMFVLFLAAGCGGGSKTPPPGSVLVNLNAYTPGPGGGFSAATASFTANP